MVGREGGDAFRFLRRPHLLLHSLLTWKNIEKNPAQKGVPICDVFPPVSPLPRPLRPLACGPWGQRMAPRFRPCWRSTWRGSSCVPNLVSRRCYTGSCPERRSSTPTWWRFVSQNSSLTCVPVAQVEDQGQGLFTQGEHILIGNKCISVLRHKPLWIYSCSTPWATLNKSVWMYWMNVL